MGVTGSGRFGGKDGGKIIGRSERAPAPGKAMVVLVRELLARAGFASLSKAGAMSSIRALSVEITSHSQRISSNS